MSNSRTSPFCEVVPVSEDERVFRSEPMYGRIEVIEISSDDEDTSIYSMKPSGGIHAYRTSESSLCLKATSTPTKNSNRKDRSRPILYEEVVELSDSSVELVSSGVKSYASAQTTKLENSDEDEGDGAILLLDDPLSGRKPIKSTGTASKSQVPVTPRSGAKKKPSVQNSKKKVKHADEQIRRREYAQKLFNDLNNEVFGNELPRDTKLTWSKRLLATAGRAKWHRSQDGLQTTEIELAEKILDCDERIRNTLAHEMCHLACWIIDKNLKESHGKLWKNWAMRVTNHRLDIKISTRHTYEISYPFQWECKKCSKIYGRFSKSIRPDEVVCGVCKEGRLFPLFETRKQAPMTPRTSRMAAAKQQGSPCLQDGSSDIDLLTAVMNKIQIDNT